MDEVQKIIDLATSINNVIEVERGRWRGKLIAEQKEREKMREGWQAEEEKNKQLQARCKRLEEALRDIIDNTDIDGCHDKLCDTPEECNICIAEQALNAKDK